MVVGVLAFQGDIAEHMDVLRRLKMKSVEIRSIDDLAEVDALIIPGGESTVMAQFLQSTGVGKAIQKRVRDKKRRFAVYGTCAGAILLAKKATGKHASKTLGLIDVTIERNAYGSQAESFEALLTVKGLKKPFPASFIRAPKIISISKKVEVLGIVDGMPVLVRQGRVMISTFHPEVRGDTRIHEMFLTQTPPSTS
jgi:5'-phosphate synthase pdxT subunit